ncbi:MAG: hypothetical protein ABEK36_03545, partial [Candidatus Aenigmatarchaeota archaeon]
DNKLGEIFEEIQENRIERIKKIAEKFNSLGKGVEINWKDIVKSADGTPGRPHVARELMRKGVVDNLQEAFDKYIGDDKSCYVRLKRPEYSEVIGKIHQSGGLAVAAHPASRKLYNFEEKLKEMKKNGLDGVEVFYNYSNVKKARLDPEEVEKLTERYGLLKTGGSDFHNEKDYEMGKPKIDYKYLEKMKKRLDI